MLLALSLDGVGSVRSTASARFVASEPCLFAQGQRGRAVRGPPCLQFVARLRVVALRTLWWVTRDASLCTRSPRRRSVCGFVFLRLRPRLHIRPSAACRLTLRSSGAPTACRQAREAHWVIFRLAGLASHRRVPLSSNVRRHNQTSAHRFRSQHQSKRQGCDVCH